MASLKEQLRKPKTKAALYGASVGANYGANAGARHQYKGTTNASHPRLQGAVGGALVGAASGASVHSIYSKYQDFKDSSNHHTDFYVRTRNGKQQRVRMPKRKRKLTNS